MKGDPVGSKDCGHDPEIGYLRQPPKRRRERSYETSSLLQVHEVVRAREESSDGAPVDPYDGKNTSQPGKARKVARPSPAVRHLALAQTLHAACLPRWFDHAATSITYAPSGRFAASICNRRNSQ